MEIIEHLSQLSVPKAEDLHIWGVHIPDVVDRLDALEQLLTHGEKGKADRFQREADRNASIAARGALRVLLSAYTGISAAEITFGYSENGKPHILDSNLGFNLSHSGAWVVMAIGCDRAVGVDIEQVRRTMAVESISRRYYTAEEQVAVEQAEDPQSLFFRIWARKEAYVKASGSTLFTELGRVSVPAGDGAEMDGWFFYDLEAGSQYAAAVVTDKPLRQMPCYDFGGLQWEN